MASSSNDPDSLVTLHFHDLRVERMRHWWTLLGEDDHADIVGFFGKFPPFMRLPVDRGLLEALASLWDPTHCCFSIGEVDLVPTMEEYAELLQLDRAFSETPVIPTVITPFLPTGFSRVSARMAGRPGPSTPTGFDRAVPSPTGVHLAQKPSKRGSGYISRRLESFDQTRPRLTKFDQAYLGGNVCAEILSGPLQFGPRAKTLRQEVHFSYHMQLSDHQELLRSSRNLSQKMTPWHKERSNGLRSQDHILRTQARLCARTCQAGILIGKLPSNGPKTLRWPLFAEPYLTSPSSDFRKSGTLQKFEKKRAGRKTRFSSRTAAFARRVFPARNKLIYEPGCVGKITTPATSWNSRFAESIPHLIGIFTGKVHENSSNAPTSGSHNSLIRTPIHANFIPLERGRRELSGDMLHDPF
uniref:DUF7745 domain-containing protein n=1 Tax=Fagus sylvatica TaxID=28930 RepID=A0A2N9G609_FAGSY